MLIPDNLLEGKKILLGVSGSIAVYKSLELVRLLTKAGAQVRVIMSNSAKKFVTPLSFETLTSNLVLDDTNESWVNDHNHIKITQWADAFIIAPITANTIAKLAHGIADNILLQCALAYPKEKLLAPSANTNMIHNPLTQANLSILRNTNYTLVNTQTKELACKTTGDGAMAEPIDIFWACAKEVLKNGFWQGRDVFITGGGTLEKIDEVRYISNFSSGKMASSLASSLYCMGATVHLVATKFENNIPNTINTIQVQSSNEMIKQLTQVIQTNQANTQIKAPYLFMAAAVSDYVPSSLQTGKLKKEKLGETFDLSLKQNIDILQSINKKGMISIGFKAEMDINSAQKNATNMLSKKSLDAVCLNVLQDSSSFGTDTNTIEFITKDSKNTISHSDKLSVAFEILKYAETL